MALAFGLAAVLAGTSPSAPSRVELEWDGTACAEGDRVRARIDELLPPGERGPTGRARVHVVPESETQRTEPRFVATVHVETRDGSTERTLAGGPCTALGDAIALVVAVTIDPLGASTRVDAPTSSTADPDAPVGTLPEPARPGPDPDALDPTEPAPLTSTRSPDTGVDERPLRDEPRPASTRRRPPLAASVIAEGGGALGLLPRIGGRVGGALALDIGRARLAVAGLHLVRRDVTHPADDRTGAEISLSSGRISGGWSFATGRFTFPLCAGIEAGAFTAAGFGLRDATTARAVWVALVPHAQPTLWATRWLGLGLHLEAPISLLRSRFGIDDFPAQDLVRVGPLDFRFGLSIQLKFFDEAARTRRTGRGSG